MQEQQIATDDGNHRCGNDCGVPSCDCNFDVDETGRYFSYLLESCPGCKKSLIAEEHEAGECCQCGLCLEHRLYKKTWMDEDGSIL